MPTTRFTVQDTTPMGQLVKSWATHLDYVTTDPSMQPPRNYWTDPSYTDSTSPVTTKTTDTDAAGKPKDWCLPPLSANFPIPGGKLPFVGALPFASFLQKLDSAGVRPNQPTPDYDSVVVVQGDSKTMVLVLPPKDALQNAEDSLLHGRNYQFASFYDSVYGGPPTDMPHCPNPQDPGRGPVMTLNAERIGEYTINNCN